MDAKYFYYAHGPLARVELGNDKVQGMDYAYTLQGWIKGVNSETLLPDNDMATDSKPTSVNSKFARDAFGYSLGYFENDYASITASTFLAKKTGSGFFADRNDLFNGNISAMVTTITDPSTNTTMAQGAAYKYDQLNRLMQMRAHRNLDFMNNEWLSGSGNDGSYAENYTYNANGSILSLKRNGLASIANGDMDNLTYIYETPGNGYVRHTNKLRQIKDAVASNTYNDDMDDQVKDNYAYDEIGNLIKDDFECIQNIKWTNFGKVKKVTRTPGCLTEGKAMPDLEFKYDALGNVIAKIVKPAGQTNTPSAWTTTFYVRDAQGNIMATYEQKNDPVTQTASYKLTEKQPYGSAHIGTENTEVEMIGAQQPSQTNFAHGLGKKHFFLTDHRGNNNVTVSDKKKPIEDLNNPGFVLYYEPDIVRAVDYFPFGREMNGREFNKDASEFGYNGKQNIKEWSIRKGGAQLYGARIKYGEGFLSVDFRFRNYPYYSPYQFSGNNPIWAVELEGLEDWLVIHWLEGDKLKGTSIIKLLDDWKNEQSSKDVVYVEMGYKFYKDYWKVQDNKWTFNKEYFANKYLRNESYRTNMLNRKNSSWEENFRPEEESIVTEGVIVYNKIFAEQIKKGKVEPLNEPKQQVKGWSLQIREPIPQNVQFKSGSAELTSEGITELDLLVQKMALVPNSTYELQGHTDNVGSEIANMKLSIQRADAAKQYLVSKGIDPSRLTTKGFGLSIPIAENQTEAGREKNRRIEIVF